MPPSFTGAAAIAAVAMEPAAEGFVQLGVSSTAWGLP